VKPPVSVPPDSEHDCTDRRPDGEEDREHVVPAKFVPVAVTTVPTRPEVGVRVNVRAPDGFTVNDPTAVFPVLPVAKIE
jgi:hypothetical protein